MARDYKKSSGDARPPGSWLSFLTGLAIGLVAAVGVYLWSNPTHPSRTPASPPPERSATREPAPDEQALEGIAAPTATPTPKFDFYKILPEIEVKVPEEHLTEPTLSDAPDASPTTAAYILQVASFQRYEEADQSKAQLALNGVRATIQRVVINGQDVWYRVHVGPYPTVQAAQTVRAQLAQVGVNAIMLKLGDAPASEH